MGPTGTTPWSMRYAGLISSLGGELLHPPFRMLAGENISSRFVVPTVASSVDLVVQVGVEVGGKRRIREIVGVPGRVEADIIETEPIFSSHHGRLRRVHGMPPRLEQFATHDIDIHGLLADASDVDQFTGG